jgi:hypothetical protein
MYAALVEECMVKAIPPSTDGEPSLACGGVGEGRTHGGKGMVDGWVEEKCQAAAW